MNAPATYITFNSITDNSTYQAGSGDERNFLSCWDSASLNATISVINVVTSTEYTCGVYVHNNASANLELTAENVRATISIPTTQSSLVTVQATIHSTNAQPEAVYARLQFRAASSISLTYIEGSAQFNVNHTTFTLPDTVVNDEGSLLGYNILDGRIPGCFDYSGYLIFKMKATLT